MSKRYQPLKEFGRSLKKPKLDVSINKNPSGASTSKPKPKSPPAQKPSSKPIDDLWNDEEDDVLILATQEVETEIAASSKTKKPDPVIDITDSEITFSEFEPKVVQHSTQQPTENLFSEMFDEDDEDIANLAAAIEKDAKRYQEGSKKNSVEDELEAIFKKPLLPKKTYPKDDTSDDEPGPYGKQKIPLSQFAPRKMFVGADQPGPSTGQRESLIPIPRKFQLTDKDIADLLPDLPEDMSIDIDEPDPSARQSAMPKPPTVESVDTEVNFEFPDLPEDMSIDVDKPGPSTRKNVIPKPIAVETVDSENDLEFLDLPEDMPIDSDEPGPSTRKSTIPKRRTIETRDKERKMEFTDQLEGMLSDFDDPGPYKPKQFEMPQVTISKDDESDEVKDLRKRLEELQKHNEKLNKDLHQVKETMQTKSGESSILRDELRQTKQKLDELKMEKVFQSETVNTESKKKIEELSKKVQDKEAELQLKNMECSVLKMRQADETKRFETSTTTTTGDRKIPNVKNIQTDANSFLYNNMGEFTDMEFEMGYRQLRIESESLMPEDYVYGSVQIESKLWRKWNTLIKDELLTMQRLLAKVQTDILNVSNETTNEIMDSIRKVFLEFTIHIKELNYGFNEEFLAEHEYNVLDEKNFRSPCCMHFSTKLYPEEHFINMRRYVAVLAVIFDRSPEVSRHFMATEHDGKPLLKLAIQFIYKLGCSLKAFAFFGIFEAFAMVLRALLYHLNPDYETDQPYLELLFELLKELVFARPGPWAMFELSFSVIDIHERFPSILSLFCINSPPETFTINRQKGVYRFSSKSCFLQVYTGLTESSFPLYLSLNEEMFYLQTKIAMNHLQFVYSCVTDPPGFIKKILEAHEEDDDSDDEEFFKEWVKRLCDSNEEYKEIYLMLQSMKKRPEFEDFYKTASTTEKTSGDEKPATSKKTKETSAKKDPQTSTEGETASKPYETFSDEQPTTSKKAAEAAKASKAAKASEAAKDAFKEIRNYRTSKNDETEGNKEEETNTRSSSTSETGKCTPQCQCFEELCLSGVRMLWLSLRQWLRFEKLPQLERVRHISELGVHLVYFLFCDYYLTCLLREDEFTTKHLIYLIYQWWIEHKEDFQFNDIQEEMLEKIKVSPIIPKLIREEEDHPENVAKDYAEWCRISGLPFDPEALDLERALKNLRLMEEATDIDDFMGFMKEPNIAMETFEFKGFTDD